MSRTQIPTKPELLVALIKRFIEGDDMHKSENPLPEKVRKAVEAALASIEPVYARLLQTKVDYQELRQEFVAARKATLKVVRSTRDAVYGLYTRDDKTVGDYGLVNPKQPRRAKKNGTTPEPKVA